MRRSACVDRPRRGWVDFWMHAHSWRGHGVHSPLLYRLCREVLAPPLPAHATDGHGKQDQLVELQCRLERFTDRENGRSYPAAVRRCAGEACASVLLELQSSRALQSYSHLQVIIVAHPRGTSARWKAWQQAVELLGAGASIDLYHYGLLLVRDGIAAHRVAIRPPRWLR